MIQEEHAVILDPKDLKVLEGWAAESRQINGLRSGLAHNSLNFYLFHPKP
jgi:hypothetical protein